MANHIENQPKQSISIQKGIHKLEEIGKKGKLHKLVTITLEHFEFLKNSMNEYSLKILAYIIKGFFISINRSYQSFIKEIGEFIDINIKGIIKQKRQMKKQSIQKPMTETEKFTLQNLSLFSENTFFEKFLENTDMTEHIQRTLKQINKSFSTIDFENMNSEEKKEYLRRNFIKPLTENIPIASDCFIMRQYEQTQTENGRQFADYINFNLDALADNVIQSLHNSVKQTQSQRMLSQNSTIQSQEVQLYDAMKKNMQKHQAMRSDAEIEISLEDYLKSIETQLDDDDSEEVYVKNLKEIIMTKSLNKFIEMNKNNAVSYLKYCNDDYQSQDQFRHYDYNNNDFSSLKNSPELIQYANNSLSQPQLKSPEVNHNIDFNFSNNKVSKPQSSNYKDLLKEKANIQSELSILLSSMKSNEEIPLNKIINKIAINIPTMINKSQSEQISCSFYNLLIVCQNEQKTIKQSESFGIIRYIN